MAEEQNTFNIILSSRTADQVSVDGSSASVSLDYPIMVPKEAQACYLSMPEASIWYNWPNLKTPYTLRIGHSRTSPTPDLVEYIVHFPPGLYDLDSINELIDREFLIANLPTAVGTIRFVWDVAVSRVTCLTTSWFGASGNERYSFVEGEEIPYDSILIRLGFAPNELTQALVPFKAVTASGRADLNEVNSILVHCSLAGGGIPVNSEQDSVIGIIPITSPPGTIINYNPNHLNHVLVNDLIGNTSSFIRFWITSETGASLDTKGEGFIIYLKLQWYY